MNTKYPVLFSPITINGMVLKNRIIAAPLLHHVSSEKMRSGIAMAIYGSGFIDSDYAPIRSGQYVFDSYNLENMRLQAEFYKQGGARASLELMHSGMFGRFAYGDFNSPMGPSACIRKDGRQVREMNEEDMTRIEQEFAVAAATAKEIGFDMVTVHGAHGWLIHQFLSPKWNHRTDEYGGPIENRVRFPLRVLRAIREAVGADFPIDIRMNGYDWLDINMSEEDVIAFAKAASEVVDMLHVSAGTDIEHSGNVHMATTNLEKHCVNIEYARKIKEAVKIPVAVVGAIKTPEEAEYILENGYADCVALGRELVADPLWAYKALHNQSEEIVPCIRCMHCFNTATAKKDVGCSVNPRYNKEDNYHLHPAKENHLEKVVIIGGGIAGMKAALTLSDRGFHPMILEKGDHLGGLLDCAQYETVKSDLDTYRRYMIQKVTENKNIEVHYGFEATPENVRELKPDAILIAVGSSPVVPPISGLELPNVHQALDIYPHLERLGKKIVIIGGGTIGVEMAIGLSDKVSSIDIIEMGDRPYRTANILYSEALRQKIELARNIHIHLNTKCLGITEKEVLTEQNGQNGSFDYDSVVIAAGMKSNTAIASSFYGITQETYMIGDCNKVAKVKDAVYDAFLIGSSLFAAFD